MDPFRIPKEPAKILLCVPPDPPEERVFFLSPLAEAHRGSETVSDLLLHPDLFLPVRVEGDGLLLVRKGAIRWVKILDPAKDEWLYLEEREGTETRRVRFVFPEAELLEGIIRAFAPEGERRASDIVNTHKGFLHLETSGGLYLINLHHVLTIRALEDDLGNAR